MDPTLRSLDLNGKRENQVNSSAEIHEFHTEKDGTVQSKFKHGVNKYSEVK